MAGTGLRELRSWRFGLSWIAVMTMFSASLEAQEPPPPPGLEFAFEVRAEVADPTVVGQMPNGLRRIIDITGGTFAGPRISGRVVPGGADWQIIREDGFTEVDARYTLETEAGELIYVSNLGIRHAPPGTTLPLMPGPSKVPPVMSMIRRSPFGI